MPANVITSALPFQILTLCCGQLLCALHKNGPKTNNVLNLVSLYFFNFILQENGFLPYTEPIGFRAEYASSSAEHRNVPWQQLVFRNLPLLFNAESIKSYIFSFTCYCILEEQVVNRKW